MFRKLFLILLLLLSFSVNAEISQVGGANSFTGLSTDTKPANLEAGSHFFETNTNDFYRYDGDSWNPVNTRRFIDDVRQGLVDGFVIYQKQGHSENVTTTYAPISNSETHQTPTAAVTLEFVSSDTADAQDDVGAREITIVGLDANWNHQTQIVSTHATDGLVAVAIPGTWIRFGKAYVSSSGTYASPTAGSHAGQILIRESGGGATWGEISIHGGSAHSESQDGIFAVPAGYTAYLGNIYFGVDSGKAVNIYGMKRSNANDVTSPYSGIRTVFTEMTGLSGTSSLWQNSWRGAFSEYSDVGFMANVDLTSASVTVDYEVLLIKNP